MPSFYNGGKLKQMDIKIGTKKEQIMPFILLSIPIVKFAMVTLLLRF